MFLLELSSLLSKVPVWAGLLLPPFLDHNSLLQGEATRGQVSILPKLISLARGCRQSHCTQFLHLTLHKSNSRSHVIGLRTGVNQSPDHQKGCERGWLPQERSMLISFPKAQSLWRQTIVISPSGETWQWESEGRRQHAQDSKDLLGSGPLGGLEDTVISRFSSCWDLGNGGKFNILQNLT